MGEGRIVKLDYATFTKEIRQFLIFAPFPSQEKQ